MPALMNLPDFVTNRRLVFGLESDFNEYVTADAFSTIADTGTAAITDAAGGVLLLTSTATDNKEAGIKSTSEIFLFAADKPCMASIRLNINEANTNDAAVAFGFMSAAAADSIVDAGATLQASYSGAVFFKRKDTLTWRVEASIGATRTGEIVLTADTSLDKTAHPTGDVVWQWLDIECIPYSSTNQKINFYIDKVLVYSLDHIYTSATEMNLFVSVKAGSANSEIVSVDYIGAWQKR